MIQSALVQVAQLFLAKKAFLVAAALVGVAAYVGDPATLSNPSTFLYTRMAQEFRVELVFLLICAGAFEFGILSVIAKQQRRLMICWTAAGRSNLGLFVVSCMAAMSALGVALVLGCFLLFLQEAVSRIRTFPYDFERRLRSEIASSTNDHRFSEALRLFGFHKALYGVRDEGRDLSVSEQVVRDKLQVAQQLIERADRTIVQGKETFETMERLRASYAINRQSTTAARIAEIEKKVQAASLEWAQSSDVCRLGSREDKRRITSSYAWLVLTANEIAEVARRNRSGSSEPLGLSVCWIGAQMGENAEERIRVLWGIRPKGSSP